MAETYCLISVDFEVKLRSRDAHNMPVWKFLEIDLHCFHLMQKTPMKEHLYFMCC